MSLDQLSFAFWKMEACGNDYVYVRPAQTELSPQQQLELLTRAPQIAREVSDRHFGIGSDGLVILTEDETLDIAMHMFNSDGSRAEICGNAIRSVAGLLAEAAPEQGSFAIGTDVGVKHAVVTPQSGRSVLAQIDMGRPAFAAEDIPLDLTRVTSRQLYPEGPFALAVNLDGKDAEGIAVSMGNPHLVVFVDKDPMDLPLEQVGPSLETAAWFPAGANIEFAFPSENGVIKQRTWERGSGETLACGSGACAVATASVCCGLRERGKPIPISLRGGDLEICWRTDGALTMKGPARVVFEGNYSCQLMDED